MGNSRRVFRTTDMYRSDKYAPPGHIKPLPGARKKSPLPGNDGPPIEVGGAAKHRCPFLYGDLM